MRLALIGGGVMAEAMIRGILGKGVIKPDDIVVSDISWERQAFLSQNCGVHAISGNSPAIRGAEAVVLAIQPRVLAEVMEELKGRLQPEQLVLSIIAGASIAQISQGLDHKAIARAMPNIPAQIGEGVSIWTASGEVNQNQRGKISSILGAIGKEIFVPDERYIDMATAISGSGPAYIFVVIESFIDAAVHIGLPRELAEELVLETISGATHMVQRTHLHPAELRSSVTSPGGTTAEGLLQLEEGGLRALFIRAVAASYEKAKTLGKR